MIPVIKREGFTNMYSTWLFVFGVMGWWKLFEEPGQTTTNKARRPSPRNTVESRKQVKTRIRPLYGLSWSFDTVQVFILFISISLSLSFHMYYNLLYIMYMYVIYIYRNMFVETVSDISKNPFFRRDLPAAVTVKLVSSCGWIRKCGRERH